MLTLQHVARQKIPLLSTRTSAKANESDSRGCWCGCRRGKGAEEEDEEDQAKDVSVSSGETEDGNATPTIIELATSIISGKQKGSTIGSAKRRPAGAAAGRVIRKRTRLRKKLTEKEKKQARDELKQMSGDASIDSCGVKNTGKDDTDEWMDQMKKGFEKDVEDPLAGLRNVVNWCCCKVLVCVGCCCLL